MEQLLRVPDVLQHGIEPGDVDRVLSPEFDIGDEDFAEIGQVLLEFATAAPGEVRLLPEHKRNAEAGQLTEKLDERPSIDRVCLMSRGASVRMMPCSSGSAPRYGNAVNVTTLFDLSSPK